MTHDEQRLQANRELVKILADEIEKRPSERFGQILRNCGFVEEKSLGGWYEMWPALWANEFNREPWETLARVRDRLGLESNTTPAECSNGCGAYLDEIEIDCSRDECFKCYSDRMD